MNSAVGSIFNEKIAEKKCLWVPWTVHRTHCYDLKFEKQAFKKKRIENANAQTSGSDWIQLIFAKTENWNWKHCSEIIFKCVNSAIGLIFNEKVAEKCNLRDS